MTTTLVLYDTTGAYGWLGELYAIMTANLASRFGAWTAQPVTQYQAGQLTQFTAAIYIGSTYDEPLPDAFLDDVLVATTPLIWINDNIWQLSARRSSDPSVFMGEYGWVPANYDTSAAAQVDYKGQQLKRYAGNPAGIMNYSMLTGTGAPTVLATAVRSNGSSLPWALRSSSGPKSNLTYIGEIPFEYMSEGDRYLAFCDLLFDALGPGTPTQYRALVRLEDLSPNPNNDPTQLNAVADYLSSVGVPFGFQVNPIYTDPNGYYNNGAPQTIHLADATDWVDAINYLLQKGGVMIEHGTTHQYSNVANPYTAVSDDDCEFYRIIENPDHTLTYQGPVPEDSLTWAGSRLDLAAQEFAAAGLPVPTLYTFPNYAASAADYMAVASRFAARSERSLYFRGLLSGGAIDYTRFAGQYFPYTVRDVYGTKVLPDTLGGIEPLSFYQYPARLPADIIADAQRNLVVRDACASFFYHPTDDISYLQQTVEGIKNLGYTFVSPAAM